MPKFRQRGMLERSAGADLFRHTLSRIATTFGRLMYLASLRDPNSGNYRHHGMFTTFGREESIAALRESHDKTFREWLLMPMEEKHADLSAYLAELDESQATVLRHWKQSRIYRIHVPASASDADKELYFRYLEVLIDLLSYASAAEPGPGSSRHP